MTIRKNPKQIIEEIAADCRKDMNDRLRSALQLLSEELYGRDVHFVLELIQNAEDNSYAPNEKERWISFTIEGDVITVRNNELGFEEKHVNALCNVGRSTKRERTLGYV